MMRVRCNSKIGWTILTDIELVLLKRKWKRKEYNNLSKAGSQYGVFSSLFYYLNG